MTSRLSKDFAIARMLQHVCLSVSRTGPSDVRASRSGATGGRGTSPERHAREGPIRRGRQRPYLDGRAPSSSERHTSDEFVAFVDQIVASQPRTRDIHIIADNLSAHKTRKILDFSAAHPNIQMHYTPTYASWLNQVALWFARVN